ncbi:MAG: hypothetical protein AB2689_21655 [Candidatus Thiodiazotropha taylori]
MTEELEINQEVFDKVVKLSAELQPLLQGAFGFFTTKTRFAVSYQDVDIRTKVQEELDHAVAILAIAHLLTIFEDSFPNNYWEEIINDAESYNMLLAYKHIRNSTITGFTGFRSTDDDEYDHFNQVMNSNDPIKGVKSFDDNKIFLSESAGNFAHTFITGLMNNIIIELHRRL